MKLIAMVKPKKLLLSVLVGGGGAKRVTTIY